MIIDELFEGPQMCPECGGISFSDLILAEKKDACYYKVKASAKVWPSAYASGRLVQCRKKGAANYGNKSEGVAEGSGDDFYAMALQRYPQLKRVDREIVINALNNAYEEYLFHYGYEGIGPDEESSMIDYAVKGLKQGVAEGSELKQAKRKYNQAAKDANADQVGAGKKIDTMKNSLRQRDLNKQGVAEGLPQTLRKVVPGYAKREIDKKMDAEKFGKTDVDRDANFARYKKIQDKLKEQGVAEEQELDEKWSQKYKSSINCANPRGFSQKAHCAGRKKNEDVTEAPLPGQRRDPNQHQIPQFSLPIIPDYMPGGAKSLGGGGGTFKGGGSKPDGNSARDIATQRNVGGNAIPSLGQSGKVVTSPTIDKALVKLGGKNVETTPGPTVKSGSTNVQLDPVVDVPAYVRQGKPDLVTIPKPGTKPKIIMRPGETMNQAVQRTKDEQEFGKFLQGQGGQTFGTPGAGRGDQGGPTAAQATSGSNQVPTIKLPNGQTIPDPARVSPSGNYNTPSDSKMDQIMKKWDQENSPVQSKGQRPWGSNVDDQPGSVRPSNIDSKGGPASWLGGGAPESKNTDSTLSKLLGLEEASPKKQPPEVDYDDEYDAMVARVRKLAGIGPMKTVYDPARRVYKNVPTAQQPKVQPKK